MNGNSSEITKPMLILMLISSVAAFCLALVYQVTLEPIAQQVILAESEAMQQILPEAEEFVEIDAVEGKGVSKVSEGRTGGNSVGYVLSVSPKGFGGPISMMVGIANDGSIQGIKILGHAETPGLGANAENEEWTNLFKGKTGTLSVVKAGVTPNDSEIQSITSATITAKAVTDGVNEAMNYFETDLGGGSQ